MTVTVDTPDGPQTGSTVIESKITAGTSFGDASGIQFGLRGEAVAVTLPNGKVLFALLQPEKGRDAAFYHAHLLARAACGDAKTTVRPDPGLCGSGKWEEFRPWAREHRLSVELGESLYPMLVTFRDIADPLSVELIDPANVTASFGAGYRLSRISLQVTDEGVTTGLREKIRWLGGYRKKTFAGNRYAVNNSLADSLGAGSFSTEISN